MPNWITRTRERMGHRRTSASALIASPVIAVDTNTVRAVCTTSRSHSMNERIVACPTRSGRSTWIRS